MDPSDVIRKELRGCVILDKDQAREQADCWRQHKDYDARERLIRSVLPWAVHLVDYYFKGAKSNVSWEDLMSVAMEGLIVGVDHFDPDRGALTTCVSLWIRQKMLRYLYANSSVVKIPDGVAAKLGGIIARGEDFQDYDELVSCAAKAKWGTLSIEQDWKKEYTNIGWLVYQYERGIDKYEEEEQEQDKKEDTKKLWKAIGGLPVRLRTIMELRLEGQTLQQIGDSMGITRERVRQLNEVAKDDIKRMLVFVDG